NQTGLASSRRGRHGIEDAFAAHRVTLAVSAGTADRAGVGAAATIKALLWHSHLPPARMRWPHFKRGGVCVTELITIEQAAQRLGVRQAFVHQMIAKGRLSLRGENCLDATEVAGLASLMAK